jgi:hypothetical protein
LPRRVRDSLLDLRDELGRSERIVGTDELPLVAKSLLWLQECRHPAGYWGVEDVAVTSLSCLAIARWHSEDAKALLETSADWLASQAVEGAWETYWDTAVAVQALVAAGQAAHPVTQQASHYLRTLDVHDEQTWSEGVHHAAQVLRALAITQAPSELLYEWTECVRKHLHADAGVYVCSQAVYALISSGTASPEDVQDEIAYIEKYLRVTGRPSEGGLRDYAPAIQALSVVPEHADLVREKAGSITSAYTDRRAWYKEPRQTAWALLALHSAESVVELVTDRATFNRAFGVALAEIPAGQRRARIAAMLWTVALVAQLEIVAALVLFWNHTSSLAINGVGIGALALTIPYSVRELIQRVRGDV